VVTDRSSKGLRGNGKVLDIRRMQNAKSQERTQRAKEQSVVHKAIVMLSSMSNLSINSRRNKISPDESLSFPTSYRISYPANGDDHAQNVA